MSTYHVELRPSEITLLRRALAIYGSFYQDAVKSKPQWERDEAKKYIAAANRLSDRLLHDLKGKPYG